MQAVRVCPICGGINREQLLRQRFEPLMGISLLDGYDVVLCKDCGFVFADNLPATDRFQKYYSDASKYEMGGRLPEASFVRLSNLADWIASHVSGDVRVIDAGAANGDLLVLLKARKFTNLTGLEPSETCVEFARTQHSLTMIQGGLNRRPDNVAPFEMLILSMVLEHVPELCQFIENVSNRDSQ